MHYIYTHLCLKLYNLVIWSLKLNICFSQA
jgi:hypothetical protein